MRKNYCNKTLEKLLKEKEDLLKNISAYKNNEKDYMTKDISITPSPHLKYKQDLLSLSELSAQLQNIINTK